MAPTGNLWLTEPPIPDGNPVSSQWGYVDGKTYLLDMYGIMQTGWITLGKKRYYLDEDGIMQTGTITVNGKKYTLAADGSLKK